VVDAGSVREPNDFADWLAINALLMTYAEHVDAGRFAEVAAMFGNATYRVEHAGAAHVSSYQGAAEVEAFCAGTRMHDDGTPRTKHVISNVIIELEGDRARSRCYATVFQQTDVLPLQPIASGRYIDRFERVGREWRFADRLITGFLLGDRSQHVVWHEGTPEGTS
jgi:3-phenylpropionate/cinnamic acid dioxygenase small subunit